MNIFIEIIQWTILIGFIYILIRKYYHKKRDKAINAEYKIDKEEELEWR